MTATSSSKRTILIALTSLLGFGGIKAATYFVKQKIHDDALIALVPAHPQLTAAERLRLGRRIEATVGAQLNSPTLDADLARATGLPVRNDAERRVAARTAAAKGMAGLNASQMNYFYALRLALATKSPAVCAGLWSGQIAEPELFLALSRITQPQLEQWFAVSIESTHIAMRRDFVVPPADDDAVRAVFQATRAALSPDEQARYDRVMAAGVNATPSDGCSVVMSLYQTAQRTEPEMRFRFYRAMLRQE